MACTYVGDNHFPNYIALSTDIVDNKIAGANRVGNTIFLTNTGAWKIILADLTLANFLFPATL